MALKNSAKREKENKGTLVFAKINYQLMGASIFLVLIGFILMIGKTDIYSFTKITLSPIIVVAGFALGIIAILKKPKQDS